MICGKVRLGDSNGKLAARGAMPKGFCEERGELWESLAWCYPAKDAISWAPVQVVKACFSQHRQ